MRLHHRKCTGTSVTTTSFMFIYGRGRSAGWPGCPRAKILPNVAEGERAQKQQTLCNSYVSVVQGTNTPGSAALLGVMNISRSPRFGPGAIVFLKTR